MNYYNVRCNFGEGVVPNGLNAERKREYTQTPQKGSQHFSASLRAHSLCVAASAASALRLPTKAGLHLPELRPLLIVHTASNAP